MALNKSELIGHLGRDPEIRYMPDGTPTATVSIATTETWKDRDSGERREATEWHRVVFFAALAKVVGEYLHTGSQVYVEGRLRTRKYTRDGADAYITEIHAKKLIMLGGKRKDDDKAPTGPIREEEGGEESDDIPF